VTLIASTDGVPGGAGVLVQYTAGVNADANNGSNLVELWRSGSGAEYTQIYYGVTVAVANNASVTRAENILLASGLDGNLAFSYDAGNTWSQNDISGSTLIDIAGIMFGNTDSDVRAGAATIGNQFTPIGGGGSTWDTGTTKRNLSTDILFTGKEVGNTVHGDYVSFTGRQGLIGYYNPLYAGTPSLIQIETLPANVLVDINNITFSAAGNAQTKNAVAVGDGGTILTSTYQWQAGNANLILGTWTQRTSNTSTDLLDVDWDVSTGAATIWIAVGDQGTILRSTNTGVNWSARTSPTGQNLNAVAGYGQTTKYFTAVGDRSTIIMSSDGGNTWAAANVAAATDSVPRDLYDVVFCTSGGTGDSGQWTAVGEGIIYKCDVASTNWTVAYEESGALQTNLTRLQFSGSWANLLTTAAPSNNQAIGNSILSASYLDTDYSQGDTLQYWLVVGNMASANIFVNVPSMTVQEIKR
jgi:photosystem II stability/assembly factor-like uncharacterized protein